jgi:hypothetical protein
MKSCWGICRGYRALEIEEHRRAELRKEKGLKKKKDREERELLWGCAPLTLWPPMVSLPVMAVVPPPLGYGNHIYIYNI